MSVCHTLAPCWSYWTEWRAFGMNSRVKEGGCRGLSLALKMLESKPSLQWSCGLNYKTGSPIHPYTTVSRDLVVAHCNPKIVGMVIIVGWATPGIRSWKGNRRGGKSQGTGGNKFFCCWAKCQPYFSCCVHWEDIAGRGGRSQEALLAFGHAT